MIQHFKLKLAFALEIGACAGYMGHYERTEDYKYIEMAKDEHWHATQVFEIMQEYGHDINVPLTYSVAFIGRVLGKACKYAPASWLNPVAAAFERLNVRIYKDLATIYPEHSSTFLEIARAEERHQRLLTMKMVKS